MELGRQAPGPAPGSVGRGPRAEVALGVQAAVPDVVVLGRGAHALRPAAQLGQRLARRGGQQLGLAAWLHGGCAHDLGGLVEGDAAGLERALGGGKALQPIGEVEHVAGRAHRHAELAPGPLGAPCVASCAHHPGVGHPLGQGQLGSLEAPLHGGDLSQDLAGRRCRQHARVERGQAGVEGRAQRANVLQRQRLQGSIRHGAHATKGVRHRPDRQPQSRPPEHSPQGPRTFRQIRCREPRRAIVSTVTTPIDQEAEP